VKFDRGVVFVAVGVLVAAAVPAGFLSADASTSALASTVACGSACTSPFVESLGSGEVLTVSGSGAGASIVMAAASATSSTQDWTPESEAPVPAFHGLGIISERLQLMYAPDSVYEFQYAPNGKASDYCLADDYGSVATGVNDGAQQYYYEPTLTVTLAQCSVTAATLWILDNEGTGNEPCDLINAGYEAAYYYGYQENPDAPAEGYASPFAEPAVLTVSSGGSVVLAPLGEIGGVVPSSQEWAGLSSPFDAQLRQSALRAKAAAAKADG
jgi:hypothetical protein